MAQLVFLANFGQKLTKITQNDQKSLEIILIDKHTHFEPNFTPNQSFSAFGVILGHFRSYADAEFQCSYLLFFAKTGNATFFG